MVADRSVVDGERVRHSRGVAARAALSVEFQQLARLVDGNATYAEGVRCFTENPDISDTDKAKIMALTARRFFRWPA